MTIEWAEAAPSRIKVNDCSSLALANIASCAHASRTPRPLTLSKAPERGCVSAHPLSCDRFGKLLVGMAAAAASSKADSLDELLARLATLTAEVSAERATAAIPVCKRSERCKVESAVAWDSPSPRRAGSGRSHSSDLIRCVRALAAAVLELDPSNQLAKLFMGYLTKVKRDPKLAEAPVADGA